MMMLARSRRTRVSVALGLQLAAVLTLAACGGSSTSGSSASGSSAGSTSSSASSTAAPSSAAAGGLTVGTHTGADGTYLTGASGKTIYLWAADKTSKSTCTGACASAWPPVISKGTPHASGSVKASDLGTTKRSNGSMQVTYDGHPLYYYAGDHGAGATSGQGSNQFGAKWWLVAPSGSAITGSASSHSTTSSPSPSSSKGGSEGGGSWG